MTYDFCGTAKATPRLFPHASSGSTVDCGIGRHLLGLHRNRTRAQDRRPDHRAPRGHPRLPQGRHGLGDRRLRRLPRQVLHGRGHEQGARHPRRPATRPTLRRAPVRIRPGRQTRPVPAAPVPTGAEAARLQPSPAGIPWTILPREMCCGCGKTCWRRLCAWQAAEVRARLQRAGESDAGAGGRVRGDAARQRQGRGVTARCKATAGAGVATPRSSAPQRRRGQPTRGLGAQDFGQGVSALGRWPDTYHGAHSGEAAKKCRHKS
jgi:hypothetical protein